MSIWGLGYQGPIYRWWWSKDKVIKELEKEIEFYRSMYLHLLPHKFALEKDNYKYREKIRKIKDLL